MGNKNSNKATISCSPLQLEILEYIASRHSMPQQIVKRAKIILLCHQGQKLTLISREVGVSLNTVKTWRNRWLTAEEDLLKYESFLNNGQLSIQDLRKHIYSALSDLPRSGKPKVFTLSQQQQIVALACDEPAHHGIPITTWTHETLAQTAISKDIVVSISARQVGRFLKNAPSPTA